MPTLDEAFNTVRDYAEDLRSRQRTLEAVNVVFSSIPTSARPEVRGLSITEHGVSLTVLSRQTTAAVAVDDLVEAGLNVLCAALPAASVAVTPYYHRLRCLNGMVQRECGAPAHFSFDPLDAHLSAVEETTKRLWCDLPARLGALRALPGAAANVPSLLQDIARRAALSPRRVMPRLLAAWQEEGSAPTEWGAVNAITRVATHATDIAPAEREALTRMGATLAFRRTHICGDCARPLTWRDTDVVRETASFLRACLQPAAARGSRT
ncbi:MAG: hypothetical protein IT349_20580 [Candidatus Eisenbacteria bacterium]|nr:hypothetical protein [Candidatus Eisenbacteria bacterium]